MAIKSALVTGGAGFIGPVLTRALIADSWSVLVADNFSTGFESNIPLEADLIKIDLGERSSYKNLENVNCDAVFHLAGQSSGEGSLIIGAINKLIGIIPIKDIFIAACVFIIIVVILKNIFGYSYMVLSAFARAILRDPKILIFDEATSALDNVSQFLIQNAINKIVKDHTVILIAHRLSTIVSADNIIILDGEEVKETGNHSELILKKGYYLKTI